MAKATDFRGNDGMTGTMINKFWDPVMSVWKPYVTIARPGHTIRNVMTDISTNMLDGIVTMKPYKDSMAMMKALGHLEDQGAAAVVALGGEKLLEGGDHMFTTVLKGGAKQEVTTLGAAQMADKEGMFLNFHESEDILEQKDPGKVMGFLQGNRYIKTMGKGAEVANNYTKVAHYRALMGRASFTKNYDTFEAASHAAASRVRQFHPDPTGLAPFEQKYVRRVMPFYSFTRQTVPLILEQLVAHPGRMTLLPKATYALAQATGTNPQSLTDQFPIGELYPSFVSDTIGGIYDFSGLGGTQRETMNFGTAEEGVLGGSTLGGNPFNNAINLLNPLIKAPIDLIAGKRLGGGQHIPDKGEYIDQQIPIVTNVAGITGWSPSGSVANILTRNGDAIDPQRQVQKGNKTAFFNQYTLNFLLGLGIADQTNGQTYNSGTAAKGPNQ